MKIKENRALSFIIVAIVYIIATVAGIFIYRALPFSFWLNLLVADVVSTVITFIFSCIFKNASVYDPYWSVQPPVILIAFAIGKSMNATRILLLISVCFWGLRLTANWAYTFKNLTHQDWRYTMLCEKTGTLYPFVNFLGIHLVPTLVVFACILPAVFAFEYVVSFNVGVAIFCALSILSATMQGIADIQMHKFRKNRTTNFIRVGLWKYARHPNYLGEILMWWSIALAVVCVLPNKWYLIAGAVANTLLFLFISIPMAEKRQSKKDGYADYKKQTRVLLPIYKKNK